ncbi:MAG TPA: recombination regulator RecX [Burkholderiales bacterium]|nr:recombination regulator RecX [Burkholderiales bacterium]
MRRRESAAEAPDTAQELKARALRHLARREHSRAELARKLAPHAESPEALGQLLDALAAKKQLSDERYAEARARQLARKYGAARIRQDLKAKGVDEGIVERVSAEDEAVRATAILSRKYRAPATTAMERARRMRFLQSRGFSHDTIRRVVSSRDDDDALNP